MSSTDTLADLYTRHGHAVLRRATRLLGQSAEADDVLHDVFLTLHRREVSTDALRDPLNWLYRATTRACLNRMRNHRTRTRLLASHAGLFEQPPLSPSPETLSILRGALMTLPDDLREIAVFAWLDRMTQAEIAEITGCSRRTVSDMLARIQRLATAAEEP